MPSPAGNLLGTVLGVVARVVFAVVRYDHRHRVLALGNIRSVAALLPVRMFVGRGAGSRPILALWVRKLVHAVGPDAKQDHGHDQEGQPQPVYDEARAPAAVLLVAAALTG